jgi:hypothetical protein
MQENDAAVHRLGKLSNFVSISFLCNLPATSEFSDSLLLLQSLNTNARWTKLGYSSVGQLP